MSAIETITHVAIRYTDGITSLPAPARHHDCIAQHVKATGIKGSGEQGFMTSTGRFVTREEALLVARAAGQLQGNRNPKSRLFSEDVW